MSLLDHTLAIDFGTSNSSVYVMKNGCELLCDQMGTYLFPSFVEYTKKGVITGGAAKRNLGKPNKYVVACVKRLIGLTNEEYNQMKEKRVFGCEVVEGDDGYPRFVVSSDKNLVSCIEVASELFKEMKSRAEIYCEPRQFDSIYLTVPADYKPKQCDGICKAAEMAGFKVLKMIAEPSAAALSYLLDCNDSIGPKERILVYDFGGGTFDASLLTYNSSKGITIIGEEGNQRLGGNDVDMAILDYVTKTAEKTHNAILIPPSPRAFRKYNLLKSFCEDAKIVLFSATSTEVVLEEINDEFDPVVLLPSTLDHCIEDVVQKTIDCVSKVIQDNHLNPGNIRHVFLVGGSSQLKIIQKLLRNLLGENCNFPAIDPQHCVSLGAMKLLLQDASNSNVNQNLVTSLSASYGIEINENEVLILLRKGSTAPLTSHCYTFQTTWDDQDYVSMWIYQCSKNIPIAKKNTCVKKEDCHPIYELSFALDKRILGGCSYIDIEFSFDIGGVLTVFCYDHFHHQLLYKCSYNPIYGSY